MKISVSKIPEGGMELRFAKDGKWFRDFLPETDPLDVALETIEVSCTVRRMKESVFIEGSAATTVAMPCGRCLETCRLPVKAAFQYTFVPPPEQPADELELSADDLDFAYYEEDTIDLDRLVFEQVTLQMPIKPLCTETCKGLCPHCGINLNVAGCLCRPETFDERLAVLKHFKVQPEKQP